jgi:cytochrome c oxidase cbb3-type subunit 3
MSLKSLLLLIFTLITWHPAELLALGPDGQALFEANCVVCHRKSGEGSIGLPLQKSKFSILSDEYLRKTIRNGRPGRIMPAFDRLSDSQVDAIVSYLREWSGTESFKEAGVIAKGDAGNGARLFAGHCANCHGDAGHGLGKGTGKSYSREREFRVIPPAVGNPGFLASASDDMLRETITKGRKGTLMGAYGKLGLSAQDIDDIIVYLRSLPTLEDVQEEEAYEQPAPTIVWDSPYDFETTLANLKQALTGSNFRIFPDRYLEQGLFPEWEVDKKQLTVRYCNFRHLYEILKIEPRLGIALPCRISVVERDDGQVQLIAMNMALIARLFNNQQLNEHAAQLNIRQLEILEEVTF